MERSVWVAGLLLAAAAAAAWIAVVAEARSMSMSPATEMGGVSGSGDMGTDLGLAPAATYVASWGVMMAAMMLPSATPMIALYGAVGPAMAERHHSRAVPMATFAAVYGGAWLATGLAVYAGAVLMTMSAESSDVVAGAAPFGVALVLCGAGIYQFTAAKRACLRQCRSPLTFLAQRWRPGARSAIRLGLAHAGYCIGCCWALMAVLVAAGAMGLAWVLLIATLVFAEKVLPYGEWIARGSGVALIALGLVVIVN